MNYAVRHTVTVWLVALLLTSCASTRITGEWRDPNYDTAISKILVIGMSANTVLRRTYEDQMVRHFEDHGVTAVSGASIIPEEQELSRDRIREAIEGKGFDTVLVTRLVDIETQKTYVRQTDYISPPPYYRNFYDYYHGVYPAVYSRDYLITDTIVTLETTVYETKDNRLVWVVTSESFNPQRANDLADELSKFIVDKLVKDGLI